jgi:AraC-like DNA-binding protein
MKCEKFTSGNVLSRFIETIIFIEIKLDELNSHPNMFLPNGNPVLVIHLASTMILKQEHSQTVLPSTFFVGLLNTQARLEPTGDLRSIFVVFKPYALYHLFNLSMFELNKKQFSHAEDIIGSDASILHQLLTTIDNNSQCIEIIKSFFETIICQRTISFDIIDIIIDRIIKDKGCIRVIDIIEYFKIAERTLRRSFLLKTGHPPKEFARIIRFKFIMQHLQNRTSDSWSEVVNETDLVDQSHFIKEFRRFTGNTPSRIMGLDQEMLRMINGTM